MRENATRQEIRRAEEEKWGRREGERDQQEWRRREEELAKRRKSALHLAFERGYNPKRRSEQWETRHEGRLHVLDRDDLYGYLEGAVPVEVLFDLVPGRVVLVRRI